MELGTVISSSSLEVLMGQGIVRCGLFHMSHIWSVSDASRDERERRKGKENGATDVHATREYLFVGAQKRRRTSKTAKLSTE